MEILRQEYLDRLRRLLDAPAITAVTGIRRAGKSVLLRQFAASLRDERQVVYVDKESFAFDSLRTARDLIDHVEATTRRGEPRGGDCRRGAADRRLGTRGRVAERRRPHRGRHLRLQRHAAVGRARDADRRPVRHSPGLSVDAGRVRGAVPAASRRGAGRRRAVPALPAHRRSAGPAPHRPERPGGRPDAGGHGQHHRHPGCDPAAPHPGRGPVRGDPAVPRSTASAAWCPQSASPTS